MPVEVRACVRTLVLLTSRSAELRRNRGVGPKGQPVFAVNNDSISENYAVTLMVGLYGQLNPLFLEYRVDGMNTSLDFCKLRRQGSQ